jgi:RHH-type proline utilization regulon transcriptional repressor/proline dehydrogenase/delta 1-pyrroline-5-carboxylate dehydrogenase
MRAENLTKALEWQNATPYGLTAGIHTLDPAEIEAWKQTVQAGNLYINRPITGAIVQRQPFGGWKRSCIGPGAKAGGPNYVDLFRNFHEETPQDALASYTQAWQEHFCREHDPSGLICESNVFRYVPCRGVVLRLSKDDPTTEARASLAAKICGVKLIVSKATQESDEAFVSRFPALGREVEFLRTPGPVDASILQAAYSSDMNWIQAPITSHGRLELRYWLREQSVSQTRHRYGQMPQPV